MLYLPVSDCSVSHYGIHCSLPEREPDTNDITFLAYCMTSLGLVVPASQFCGLTILWPSYMKNAVAFEVLIPPNVLM